MKRASLEPDGLVGESMIVVTGGVTSVIFAVGAEVADAEPVAFDPVTTTRIVELKSAWTTAYD